MKTSKEWYDLFCKDIIMIYDPDGWDRQNYQYSYYEELIDLKEFRNRLSMSTINGLNRFIEIEQKMKEYEYGYVIIATPSIPSFNEESIKKVMEDE